METLFEKGSSFIHELDPRARLVVAAFSIVVALPDRCRTLVPSVLGGMAIFMAAGLPPLRVAKRLLIVNGFVAFLWVFRLLCRMSRLIERIPMIPNRMEIS